MSKLKRRQLTGLLGAAGALGLFSGPAEAAPTLSTLFVIARSKNQNVVRYAARHEHQALDRVSPIEAHWLMLAEDGRREQLTWAERQLAYGFSVASVSEAGCQLRLVAFPARALTVERRENGFRALVTIAGQRAKLERIFVQTREGALLPSVAHVDLYGRSLDDLPVHERIAAH